MPRALLAGTLGLTCAAALVGAGLGSGCGPTQPTVVEVPDPAKLPDARPESIPDAPPPIATCIGHGDRPAIVRAASTEGASAASSTPTRTTAVTRSSNAMPSCPRTSST